MLTFVQTHWSCYIISMRLKKSCYTPSIGVYLDLYTALDSNDAISEMSSSIFFQCIP